MKLADLRRLAIREKSRIRFRLGNGMECVVTEHGVAQVPALKGVPDFNVEQELASAREFLLEPVGTEGAPKPRPLGREQLEAMTSSRTAAAASSDREEE